MLSGLGCSAVMLAVDSTTELGAGSPGLGQHWGRHRRYVTLGAHSTPVPKLSETSQMSPHPAEMRDVKPWFGRSTGVCRRPTSRNVLQAPQRGSARARVSGLPLPSACPLTEEPASSRLCCSGASLANIFSRGREWAGLSLWESPHQPVGCSPAFLLASLRLNRAATFSRPPRPCFLALSPSAWPFLQGVSQTPRSGAPALSSDGEP